MIVKRKEKLPKSQLTIAKIKKAAKRIFFKKGFVGTSMDSIATEAGLAKGTLYIYFKSKDDLYLSLMLPVLDELGRRLLEVSQKVYQKQFHDKQSFIQELFNVYYATYQYDPDGMRIIQAFQLGNYFSAMPAERLQQINRRAVTNNNITREFLSLLMKEGLIKTMDPIELTDILWSLVYRCRSD